MFRAAVGVGQGPISIYLLDSEPEPRPGATPVVVLGQVNLGPRLRGQVNLGPRRRGQVNLGPRRRGQVNLGPRRRGDGVRLTATRPILPRSRAGGSLIL
jgi:hypothetical protein